MIVMVSGPTSVGKSRFLNHPDLERLSGIPDGAPVLFPSDLKRRPSELDGDCFLHYNILRINAAAGLRHRVRRQLFSGYRADSAWRRAIKLNVTKRAIVLLASRSELRSRIAERKYGEAADVRGNGRTPYPTDNWLSILDRIDLQEVYRAWCDELRRSGIEYSLILSSSGVFRPVAEGAMDTLGLND